MWKLMLLCNKMTNQLRRKVTNSWKIKMNLTLNKYQIKSLYMFKKLLFLENMLATRYQHVHNQFNQFNLNLLNQFILDFYIFLETSIVYAQHECSKHVTIFFEQVALIAKLGFK
jgi:hypothetical protein